MSLGFYSFMSAGTSLKSGQPIRGRKNESPDRAFRHRSIVSRRKSFMAGEVEKAGTGLDQSLLSFEFERGRQKHKRTLTFVQALFSPRMLSIA